MREVIGVVGDIRQQGPTEQPENEIYLPAAQQSAPRLLLTLRTTPGLPPPGQEIRALVHELAPEVPVDSLGTMDDLVARSIADQRFLTWLVTCFGALALVVAVVGTYSTASCAAARRHREHGIRRALGAQRAALIGRTLGRDAMVVGVGIGVGLLGSWGLSRWLQGSLFGLTALDPIALALACTVLAATALAAALGPALRASRVDPAEILRVE
jgi:predicted lysophospholipase L1 biosynthesis ABC-type transport system permease subunit